jgi:hypothetical protein
MVSVAAPTDGFKGFTLLLDRSSGEGVGISFW